ncbi:MAG: 4-hydroxy-tetrahydrodipicolinate reductase [Rhodanobacteraceae bacterium]
MSSSTPIAVHGAAGRMGREIVRLAHGDPRVEIVAALVKSATDAAGIDGIACTTSLEASVAPRVLIDFSTAYAFDEALALARSRRIAFVSGTTGISPTQHDALRDAAATIPVLWSANFRLGIGVLARLARDAARALASWDCEIAEAHHRNKKDAPSGTALALGRAIADARGVAFEDVAERDRANTPRTRAASIGFAVTRAGDIVGEHTVTFAGAGERIELTHRATDRAVFARGAIEAAIWLATQRPGSYALAGVLGLRDD